MTEIDIRTRIFDFAERTVGFRQLPIASQLANPQIRLKTSETAISWRMPVWRRSYPTVRLGAPAKLKNLHSKIGRRVDFSSYKKPVCSQSGPGRRTPRVKCTFSFPGILRQNMYSSSILPGVNIPE
jgi:hypothetical protein